MAKSVEKRLVRRRLANAYLSTIISISLVLFLVGMAALLLLNAGSVSDYFKEHLQVSVLMKQEVGDEEAMAFQEELERLDFIRQTRFVSKEQGMEEMKSSRTMKTPSRRAIRARFWFSASIRDCWQLTSSTRGDSIRMARTRSRLSGET